MFDFFKKIFKRRDKQSLKKSVLVDEEIIETFKLNNTNEDTKLSSKEKFDKDQSLMFIHKIIR